MTELSQKIDAGIFQRMANSEVMGWKVAAEAQSIANFILDLKLLRYDTYISTNFDSYAERMIRGYQINNCEYEGLHIDTTFDLHVIQIDSMTLKDLIQSIKEKWFPRIQFAVENGLFKN